MTKADISIVIPTHERQHVLKRAIEYYQSFDLANIIICDSSVQPNLFAINNDKIVYHHLPGMSFAAKILFGITESVTPFICLSADDDFLGQTGLNSGLNFLKQHHDYVSVQGMYTQFTYQGNSRTLFYNLSNKYINNQLQSDIPEERVVASMKPYIQQLYSLHRKEAIAKAIQLAVLVPRITNVEIACSLVSMIFGKHKILNEFWMARDSRRYTAYNLSGNNINTVIVKYEEYLKTSEGESFKYNYGIIFASLTNSSVLFGEEVFNKAFEQYFAATNEKKEVKSSELKIKSILKKWVPGAIAFQWRKRKMNQIYFGNQCVSLHPDWMFMKKIINKYGFLDDEKKVVHLQENS